MVHPSISINPTHRKLTKPLQISDTQSIVGRHGSFHGMAACGPIS